MPRALSLALAALASAALLSACASSSKPAASAPASGGATSAMPSNMVMPSASLSPTTIASDAAQSESVVHIKNFSFSAPSRPIAAGSMFEVVNDDSTAHTYEDVKHAFDSGTIKAGGMVQVKAPATGTYSVKCDFHPSMHGTLTVS